LELRGIETRGRMRLDHVSEDKQRIRLLVHPSRRNCSECRLQWT